MFSFVDKLAMRIPPSCCIVCQLKSLREPHHQRENKTAALVFDPGTEVYTLKRLEDIDVEKAIYRNFLPTSAQSIKLQLHGETKSLAEVTDDACWRKAWKHQCSLADGFYIMPGRAGTQTTLHTKDPHGDQLAELPAPGLFNRGKSPVELPADEISSPLVAPHPFSHPISHPASPARLLPPPRPRSANSRKASPLLAPPPTHGLSSDTRNSYSSSSVGSASIHITYLPTDSS